MLELMLVMMVMAVVAAFVLPNLFRPAAADLDDTARNMARVLRLAGEEAEVRGTPLRCNILADSYDFELLGEAGSWQPLSEAPFGVHKLAHGISIDRVKLADASSMFIPNPLDAAANQPAGQQQNALTGSTGPDSSVMKTGKGSDKQAVLGRILFMIDGMLTLADVQLQADTGERTIELRPGPAGIRVLEAVP